MQVPAELRKCVCFLRARLGASWYTASGFFVSVPFDLDDPKLKGRFAVYLVTARHNISTPDTLAKADEVEIRLNRLDGGSEWVHTDLAGWQLHGESDIAVLPWAPSRAEYDYLHYPAYAVVDSEFIEEHRIGPGDEVFIAGQLVYHPGQTQMLPVIRTGSIAAFPEDQVQLETGWDNVILVEVRSIGGLSGSPAFLHLPDFRRDREGTLRQLRVLPGKGGWRDYLSGPNYLLGIVHGVYPSKTNDPDGLGIEGLNTGISVVIPAKRILDIVDSPAFVAERDSLKARLKTEDETH